MAGAAGGAEAEALGAAEGAGGAEAVGADALGCAVGTGSRPTEEGGGLGPLAAPS
jgi:hypothetical protein